MFIVFFLMENIPKHSLFRQGEMESKKSCRVVSWIKEINDSYSFIWVTIWNLKIKKRTVK